MTVQKEAEQGGVHDVLTTNVQVAGLDPSYAGTIAMPIVPLPLSPNVAARALLHLGMVVVLVGGCASQAAEEVPAQRVRVPLKPGHPACLTYYDLRQMRQALRQKTMPGRIASSLAA
jgi:hypothetical protein